MLKKERLFDALQGLYRDLNEVRGGYLVPTLFHLFNKYLLKFDEKRGGRELCSIVH